MQEYLSNSPDFRETDYENMCFPIHRHEQGEDIFKEFPIFAGYRIFFQNLGRALRTENIMQYISYCFDKGSPFVKKYNDIVERRFWSAVQAGFNMIPGENRFDEEVDNMIRGKNVKVNNMIIQYCLLQGDEDFSVFVACNETLRVQLQLLINSDDDLKPEPDKATKSQYVKVQNTSKDIKVIIENVRVLRAQIAEVRMALFMTNEDRLLNATLYDFMEAKSLGLSPEAYAERRIQSKNK